MPHEAKVRELCEKMLTAFIEAGEFAKTRPEPETPAWKKWLALFYEAVATNSAYIDALDHHRGVRPAIPRPG
jgi:hypothetical protein